MIWLRIWDGFSVCWTRLACSLQCPSASSGCACFCAARHLPRGLHVRFGQANAVAGNITLDQEALKSALLALSPAEKLGIAGDRIRLARSNVKPRVSGQAVSQRGCTQTCPAYCQLRRAR